MVTNDRITKVQQQYFDFCTELIKKIPFENINPDQLMQKAFLLRDNLEKEIIQSEMNYKNNCLEEIKSEIQKLKLQQESIKNK